MKYGGEDKELGVRLTNGGVRGQHLRYVASVVHLDHPRGYVDRALIAANKARIRKARRSGASWTPDGIVKRAAAMIALVINLARAPERWASMARQAAERGLAIERLEAVDGRDPAALAASSAAPDSGLRPGEIACFESHRAAWRRIADGDAPFGLVLEDDVFLGPTLPEVLAGLPAAAEGLDIVKLNAHPRGMLVHTLPLARVAGRALRPAGAGHQRLERLRHLPELRRRGRWRSTSATRQPLDLALFDTATCPAIAQLDPAVTIQQRYADFRFLDEVAPKTSIQPDRAGTARARVHPLAAARREAARVWRRRVMPAAQPLLNLARAPEDRQDFRRIAFDG